LTQILSVEENNVDADRDGMGLEDSGKLEKNRNAASSVVCSKNWPVVFCFVFFPIRPRTRILMGRKKYSLLVKEIESRNDVIPKIRIALERSIGEALYHHSVGQLRKRFLKERKTVLVACDPGLRGPNFTCRRRSSNAR